MLAFKNNYVVHGMYYTLHAYSICMIMSTYICKYIHLNSFR